MDDYEEKSMEEVSFSEVEEDDTIFDDIDDTIETGPEENMGFSKDEEEEKFSDKDGY